MSKVLKVQDGMSYDVSPKKIPVDVQPTLTTAEVNRDPLVSQTRTESLEEAIQARLQEADRLLQEARQESERILEQAKVEAGLIRQKAEEEAFQVGYQAGQAEGAGKAEAEYQQLVERAAALVSQAQTTRLQLIESMHAPLVQIAMVAMKQILKRELEMKPANIKDIVLELLSMASESVKAEVRVHPDDYSEAIAAHPMWQSMKFGGWDVAVMPSTSIRQGGCMVRFDSGRADATLETKLAILQETLSAYVERRVSEYVDGSAQ